MIHLGLWSEGRRDYPCADPTIARGPAGVIDEVGRVTLLTEEGSCRIESW